MVGDKSLSSRFNCGEKKWKKPCLAFTSVNSHMYLSDRKDADSNPKTFQFFLEWSIKVQPAATCAINQTQPKSTALPSGVRGHNVRVLYVQPSTIITQTWNIVTRPTHEMAPKALHDKSSLNTMFSLWLEGVIKNIQTH